MEYQKENIFVLMIKFKVGHAYYDIEAHEDGIVPHSDGIVITRRTETGLEACNERNNVVSYPIETWFDGKTGEQVEAISSKVKGKWIFADYTE